jgi:HSP20 family protein
MSEKKDDQKKPDDAKKKDHGEVDVEFGIGKISFSSIFQGIGNVIDLVSKLEEEAKGEVKHEREFTTSSGHRAVYGLSVRTGIGGMPTVESFGNIKKTAKGPVVEEERQPLVDIFDEKDHILIIVELPGVEEERISTNVKGDILTLSATGGDRKYYTEVVLPKDADASTLKRKYTNGVLEIRMSKK